MFRLSYGQGPGHWSVCPSGKGEHCWAFSFLSVAAATPSAGCFGPSDFRIPSRPVGSQVKPCLVLRLGFLRCTCRKEAECPGVKAGGESGCLGQRWLHHTILHPWTSAFCFPVLFPDRWVGRTSRTCQENHWPQHISSVKCAQQMLIAVVAGGLGRRVGASMTLEEDSCHLEWALMR